MGPLLLEFEVTTATVLAAPGVQSSTLRATIVHRARKPIRDQSAGNKNPKQYRQAEQGILHSLYLSLRLR